MKARLKKKLANKIRSRLMEDDERKAMFAHMHGGGGGGPRSGGAASDPTYSGDSGSKTSAPPAARSYDSRITMHPTTFTGETADELIAREKKESADFEAAMSKAHDTGMGLGIDYATGSVGLTGAVSTTFKNLSSAAKKLAPAAASGGIAYLISAYRDAHPELSPKTDHYLSALEDLALNVAIMSGLSAVKKGTVSALPKMTAAEAKALGIKFNPKNPPVKSLTQLTKMGDALAAWWANNTPTLSAAVAKPKSWYDALASFTGSELPALKNLGRLTAKNLTKAELHKTLARSAYIAGLTGLVEVYEQDKIGDYKAEMRKAWAEGEAYKLPADYDPFAGDDLSFKQQLIAGGIFATGTLGNPVEKQIRNYFSGKLTKNLADRADYELKHERITMALKEGYYTKDEAQAEYEKLAEYKPWAMSGSAVYSVTPATIGLLKFGGSKILDYVERPTKYGTIDPVQHERDADTFTLTTGETIRYLGGDATEIAHASKPGSTDQPMSREAAAAAMKLNPDGSAVRLTAGGEDEFEYDKYGRTLARVEKIPSLVAKIPGLRKVWPGEDSMESLHEQGLVQPRYEELKGENYNKTKDHAAAATAYEKKIGVYDPAVRAELEALSLYTWTPSAIDTALAHPSAGKKISQYGNFAGIGLLGTGHSGLATKLGASGTPLMQGWNAAMAGLGTAQYIVSGPKNTGKEYNPPKQLSVAQLKAQTKAAASRKAALARAAEKARLAKEK
jgi:endonuclease YncB( thermonuclease family)